MVQSNADERQIHRTRVLLIEDDQAIRDTFAEVLRIEGYVVDVAENGLVGLEILRQMTEPCLVLLDLNMPVMDGREFLAAKNEDKTLQDVPVMVLSAVAKLNGNLDGVAGHLAKPLDLEELLNALREFGVYSNSAASAGLSQGGSFPMTRVIQGDLSKCSGE